MNEVALTSTNFSTVTGSFDLFSEQACNDAILDILQAELNWPFMIANATKVLTAHTNLYDINTVVSPNTYAQVDWDSFYIAADNSLSPKATATKLNYIPFELYQISQQQIDLNVINAATGYAFPNTVFRTFDGQFGVSGVPDQAYTVKFRYWKAYTALSAYNDNTVIPDRFVNVIVDGMLFYLYAFRQEATLAGIYEKKFAAGIARMRTELINHPDYMRADFNPVSRRISMGASANPII